MNSSDRPVVFVGVIKSRGVDVALLTLAIALGVCLNWQRFTADYLGIDEHVAFWIASGSSPSTLLDRSVNYSATPPLSFVLQRVSLDVFGAKEWSLRLPAAIGYLGAIVTVWWFGVRWLSPLAGGLAALLVATNSSVLQVAVAARPYSVGLLLAVLAMHATVRLLERPRRWFHWPVWLIVNLALVQTHYLFAALAGAEWLVLAWPSRERVVTKREFAGWSIAFVVLALSAMPGFLRVWERRGSLNWTTARPEWTSLTGLFLPVEVRVFRDPVWWSIVGVTLVWLAAVNGLRLGRWTTVDERHHTRRSLARLTVQFIVPSGGLWLLGWLWFASLAAERYLVICVPAGALVLGEVLSLLRGRVAPILVCLAMLLLGGLGPRLSEAAAIPERFAIEVVRPRYHRVVDRKSFAWREAGSIVGRSGAKLVLVGSGLTEMWLVPAYVDDSVFHDYVTCRLGRLYCSSPSARLGLPMIWPSESPETVGFFRHAIEQVRPRYDRPTSAPPVIALVCGTDTDLLRATEQRIIAILHAAGAVEVDRVQYEDVVVIFFAWVSAGGPE